MQLQEEQYPEFIKKFKRINLPDSAVEATALTGAQGQVVFFDMPAGVRVPVHQHDDSWAIVVSGEISMTIGTQNILARQGDSWFVPKGTDHGGVAVKPTRLLEVFCESRYDV